ncbi:hypothetical protein BG011_003498, partial [Mortierella polycephala]
MDINHLLDYPGEDYIGYTPNNIEELTNEDEDEGEEDDSNDYSVEVAPARVEDVISMLVSVQLFFQQQDGDYRDALSCVRKLNDMADTIQSKRL